MNRRLFYDFNNKKDFLSGNSATVVIKQPGTTMKQELIQKLNDKTAVIGIIGLGYVGIPLSLRFAEVDYKVLGFDIDPEIAEKISVGKTYIKHIPDEAIKAATDKGFEATTDFTRAEEVNALILCVPTPLDNRREPDLGFVTNTMDSLLPHLRKGQVVSLESTT